MAEGRICLSPSPYRTNQILLGRCASNTCRYHFNSLIGGANSYGYLLNENLLGRLPCDCQAAGELGGESRRIGRGETRFASSRTVERVLMKNILIVDDVATNRELIREALMCREYKITEAVAGGQALEMMENEGADLVITDLRMPGISGVDLLRKLRVKYPDTTVILVTACGTVESAVEAMKAGAHDYITRPLDVRELRSVVRRVLQQVQIQAESRALRDTIDRKGGFENMVGHSQTLLRVLDQAVRVAPTNSTILIQGETGTGKELLARGIHVNSKRSGKPFVTLNCGAIPRELLESELFGHVRGSFSGAVMDRKGKAEAAHGGTLFLDEIGEMPLEMQVKVLRLIQEGEIEKVGATANTKVDIRVIAATHRSLPQMVENGTFREDLYYRLNVIPLSLPNLRQRPEDIPELVRYFFARSCVKHSREDVVLPERLHGRFSAYRWPGNVRELENTIERIVVLTQSCEVDVNDLPSFLQHQPASLEAILLDLPSTGISLSRLEKDVLSRALEKSNWNQSQAARYLGLSRKTLIYRMRKFGLAGPKPLDVPPENATDAEPGWAGEPCFEANG
jgi:DNA-binding NtrC family response regulator